jgi:ribosomal protein L7/L12
MAEVSREQVKDFIKNMSLMDAATLVKELETELGVSAAAPMMGGDARCRRSRSGPGGGKGRVHGRLEEFG